MQMIKRMMRKHRTAISNLLLCALAALWGCGDHHVDSIEEYSAWLNDPAHHLVQSKVINGLQLTVKYLPPEYMAYQDIRNSTNSSAWYRDSIIALYRSNVHFLLSIGLDGEERRNADVMTSGVGSYPEFARRVLDMNFDMENHILLKTRGGECRPVLAVMENTYGIKGRRDIVVAFSPAAGDLKNTDEMDFVLYDEIFGTGISHFVFQKNNMNGVVRFPFDKL